VPKFKPSQPQKLKAIDFHIVVSLTALFFMLLLPISFILSFLNLVTLEIYTILFGISAIFFGICVLLGANYDTAYFFIKDLQKEAH